MKNGDQQKEWEARVKVALHELPGDRLTFRPVTPGEWDDLQSLFEEPGVQKGCWCMYWRLKRSDFQKQYGEANRRAMKRIIESGKVPGILAYLDKRPIGWISVAPREDYPVLGRSPSLKAVDSEPVWSITCFFVSKPYRRNGVSKALIEAAVGYARENGARIVEAYPMVPERTQRPHHERYMGVMSTLEKVGFSEVLRRSRTRSIMRYYLVETDYQEMG